MELVAKKSQRRHSTLVEAFGAVSCVTDMLLCGGYVLSAEITVNICLFGVLSDFCPFLIAVEILNRL